MSSMINFKTKFLSFILVVALVATMMPITTFAEDNVTIVDSGTCGEKLVWEYDSNGVLSISGEGEMENYESYNSAPWYEYIRKQYTWGTTMTATKIVVNEGVTSIGTYAFSYCGCPVELPETLNVLYPYAFYHAFGDLKNATLTLPNGLTVIGEYAFYFSDITQINFPATLKTIGKNAFGYCRLLKTIELNSGLESIHKNAFEGCATLEKVTIPESITSIPDSCFSGCSSLSEVSIPDTVTSIGFKTFAECTSLEYIDLPNSLNYVSGYLFYECSNLKHITIPNTVNSIGWHAFDGCQKLNSIKFNENLKWIETNAFYNCYDLKSVFIPSLTTYFESSSSFGYCDDLVTGEDYQKIEDFKLYCWKGSEAEESAIKYGTNYEAIDIVIEERCVYAGEAVIPMVKITIGDKVLSENSDYIIECFNNDKVGVAAIKLSFINEYVFLPEIEKIFKICYGISECTVTLDKDVYQYHDILPKIQVEHEGKSLTCGVDYEVEYIIGTESWTKSDESISRYIWDIGKGVARIKGIGIYAGEYDLEFEITKFDMSNAKLSTPWTSQGDGSYGSGSFNMKNFEYDGTAKIQSGYRVCDNNDTISAKHYEVSYQNNVDAGTATMVIKGKGDYYTGTLEKTFFIDKAPIDNLIIELSQTTYVYDGTVKMPLVTVKEPDGDRLAEGTDYTLSYDTNTKKVGTYKVTVVFKGNYVGAKDLYFKIIPQGQWMHDGVGWWYQNTDGTYPINCWKKIDNVWYYFNGSGYILTGWQSIGGTWYYFNGSGAMVTGWQSIGGTWYYFAGSGAMVIGWQSIGGTWYYFNGSGAMVTGWQSIGGTWYYFAGSGTMTSNQWIGNYYLQADGSMAVNKRIGIYYVGADGAWIPGI